MLAYVRRHEVHAVIAEFDGLWWFAAVGPEIEFERVLPKRGSRRRRPQGAVPGGTDHIIEQAIRPISAHGPRSGGEIAQHLLDHELASGKLASIHGIVNGALRKSPWFGTCWLKDDRHRRWKLRPNARTRLLGPHAPPIADPDR